MHLWTNMLSKDSPVQQTGSHALFFSLRQEVLATVLCDSDVRAFFALFLTSLFKGWGTVTRWIVRTISLNLEAMSLFVCMSITFNLRNFFLSPFRISLPARRSSFYNSCDGWISLSISQTKMPLCFHRNIIY